MQKSLIIAIYGLLLFNGLGAIYGGSNLITHPDGTGIGLSLKWLKYSPFSDYFIPGIILLIANGFFSLATLIEIILQTQYRAKLVISQGAILAGWIIIQVIIMRTVIFLQFLLLGIAIALMLTGYQLRKGILKTL